MKHSDQECFLNQLRFFTDIKHIFSQRGCELLESPGRFLLRSAPEKSARPGTLWLRVPLPKIRRFDNRDDGNNLAGAMVADSKPLYRSQFPVTSPGVCRDVWCVSQIDEKCVPPIRSSLGKALSAAVDRD